MMEDIRITRGNVFGCIMFSIGAVVIIINLGLFEWNLENEISLFLSKYANTVPVHAISTLMVVIGGYFLFRKD